MKTLIVGAGAVGQVYGRHLAKGGAEVAFYVKPKYVEAARAGFDLYPIGWRRARRAPVRFEGFRVLASMEEVAREPWDAAILCVSSTALREGDWLAHLARATGDATLVLFQPGIEDRAFALERVPEARLVSGMIGIVSWQAPLPGESLPRPGVAYWLPPLARTALGGPGGRAAPVVAALARGGLPARLCARAAEVEKALGRAEPLLGPLIAALECAGWSFRALRRDPVLGVALRAGREIAAIAGKKLGIPMPRAPRLLGPSAVRIALRLAPALVPFPLEAYFRVHFSKVGEQTVLNFRTLAALAERFGLEASAIGDLLGRLDRVRAAGTFRSSGGFFLHRRPEKG